MKPEVSRFHALTVPQFIDQAIYLDSILKKVDVDSLERLMSITSTLAAAVKEKVHDWNGSKGGSAAALTFRGDIYSGLSAAQWDEKDAEFAQKHLLILSGLYGILKPFDMIQPYRLEMGYKLKVDGLILDKYWEKQLQDTLDQTDTYINLTAKEYFKVIEKSLSRSFVIAPKFLSVNEKTGLPVFVTVHAKIARGAFANWIIKNKIDEPSRIIHFDQLGYRYDKEQSTEREPVFVCNEFGGIGLSVRLK